MLLLADMTSCHTHSVCDAYVYAYSIMYIKEDNCVYYVDYMESYTVPYIRVLIGGVGCQCGAGIEATFISHTLFNVVGRLAIESWPRYSF